MMTEAPVRNNTSAVIVTHNPGGSVFRLLNAIESQVDQIIIVDNASNEKLISELTEYSRYRNMVIIRSAANDGIAAALNLGMDASIRSGYTWAITFDQDTIPFSNILQLLSHVFHLCPQKERVGAIGANFGTGINRSYYRVPASREYSIRDYLITSGCLLRLEAYQDAGSFRTDFFIDNVDIEFSLRLRKKGWLNLISREWGMVHQVGKPVQKRFLWFRVKSTGHEPSRRYFMARNHVLMTRDYLLSFPYFIAKLNFFFILSIIGFMIAEKDRRSKMKSSIKGLREGFRMKTKGK